MQLPATACAVLISLGVSQAATTLNISFWGFDQYAGSTPYYSHYQITNDVGVPVLDGMHGVAVVNLFDSGWGYSTIIRSSYHIEAIVGDARNEHAALRTVGWHNYEFSFNLPTNTATISLDGNIIQTGTYSGPINWFSFIYNGHTQKSLVDDFSVEIDGTTVYTQNFDSSSLGTGWAITRQDAGAFINSGDTSNPHSGNGALALGANVAGIAFDLNSVPEPSAIFLGGLSAIGLLFMRKR